MPGAESAAVIAHHEDRGAAIGQRDALGDHIDGHALGIGRFSTWRHAGVAQGTLAAGFLGVLQQVVEDLAQLGRVAQHQWRIVRQPRPDRALRVTRRVQPQHVLDQSLICSGCQLGGGQARVVAELVDHRLQGLDLVDDGLGVLDEHFGVRWRQLVAQLEGCMRSAASWIGVRGFLISWARRRATSVQATARCAVTTSLMSSKTMTYPTRRSGRIEPRASSVWSAGRLGSGAGRRPLPSALCCSRLRPQHELALPAGRTGGGLLVEGRADLIGQQAHAGQIGQGRAQVLLERWRQGYGRPPDWPA
jgi:hypothetical protein